ncbi:hypothetical protein CC86DRAFT_50534 [Ophiobolus disseminans]|uniref:Uncharacterized protein n=1 Tax=Ophiobolus disseminans TaxID=1469910 RepID=A0A6A6ZVG5_9PLEO|nr:hypothetical protein CC86DRAFT_50534 [Ophiobolus disseminans]
MSRRAQDTKHVCHPLQGCRVTRVGHESPEPQLQGLKFLLAKFKGTKTWSRVKYVLNDTKVNKATQNLEHAKALLASALTVACGELSALGHTRFETVVQQSFDLARVQADTLAQSLTTKLDSSQRAIVSTLSANHLHQTSQNDQHQQLSVSRFGDTQQQLSSVQHK